MHFLTFYSKCIIHCKYETFIYINIVYFKINISHKCYLFHPLNKSNYCRKKIKYKYIFSNLDMYMQKLELFSFIKEFCFLFFFLGFKICKFGMSYYFIFLFFHSLFCLTCMHMGGSQWYLRQVHMCAYVNVASAKLVPSIWFTCNTCTKLVIMNVT